MLRVVILLVAATAAEHVREFTVRENARAGTLVGHLGDELPDAAPPYTIVPVPGSAVNDDLKIDPHTGEIRTRMPLDRENRDHYALVAIPASGDNIRVVVRVLDENDNAPTFPTPIMNVEFSENTPRDVKRKLNPARDQDLGIFNTQRYNIVSGNTENAYRLSSHRELDGVLYLDLQINGFLDRETTDHYELVIEALDGGTPPLRGTMTVNITILDVNDNPPVFAESAYSATIPENATIGTTVLRVSATDSDAGENGLIEYSINRRQSDKENMFKIDPETGEVTVNKALDFETKELHELVVVARDKGAQPLETTAFVSIRVTDVNDNQPTIDVIFLSDDATPKISESAQLDEFVARISVHDPDSKAEYANVNVTLSGGDGHFDLRTHDNIIYLVVVALPLDRESRSTYTLNVVATDKGSPPLHASRIISLRVTDVNDNPPVFLEGVYKTSVPEAAASGTPVIQVSASDVDEAENSEIRYSLLTTPQSEWFAIDERSGLVTTRSRVDCETNPMPKLIVVATDRGTPPLSSTATLLVTVLDVNDNEPIFDQSFYNVTVSESEAVGSCILKMGCKLTFVDDILNRSFYKLGLIVGKQPGYFIVIPILLTLLMVTGYQRVHYEMDPEYLFSPVSGQGKLERRIVEEHFKVNYSHRFNVGRITRAGRFGRVIIVAKDNITNMLRTEVWKELRQLDELVQNITVTLPNGETFTYREECARWEGQCFVNDILNLDKIIGEVENGELNLTFPIMFNPVTWEAHAFPVYFGGSKIVDDTIVSVPAVQLVWFVRTDTKLQQERGAAWEDAFLDDVGIAEDTGRFKHISVARFASRTLDHELEKNTRTVVPFFSSTFILMGIFSIITCMMGDWVRSKPWLGLLGNISAVMATVAAFGCAIYLGISFIGINLAAPFLMIGIGIDDTFVMLAAWRRTSPKLPVPERMATMLSEAAVSITITSVTDMLSFFIGIFSPFPSVQIFCMYSGLAVCFTFVWHLTFFAGCVAVSGYREKQNRHTITWLKVLPESRARKEEKSWLYRIFCSGGIDVADPDNPIDNKEHCIMAFFRTTMANILNNNLVKALVIVVFLIYLAGAGYGVTNLKEGLERRKLSKVDSYSVEFFDREDLYYREFPYRIQVVITGEYNYSDPKVQDEVEMLTQKLENTSYISNSLYTESWLRTFVNYVSRNNDYLNVTIDNEPDFIKNLKELWLFPANPFSLDVKFNKAGDQIVASRFLIQAINISGTNHEKEMVKVLRDVVAESSLNASVFHPYFVFFDQFELVRPTSLQNLCYGALMMMLTSFIFIPNISCSLWVAFSIISIEIGVVGYMALWDINLDSISMINLIMCIGFSVDFTAHICYAYMASKAKTPNERVSECLYSLGLPIVQGSFSTILGVVALLLADSYIFSVFFKMVFMVIFFGAMHGLFLLPVLLSLFGPGSCTRKTDDIKMLKVDKCFPHPYCLPHPQLVLNDHIFNGKNINPNGVYKIYGDDKDLGIGTSGEDTSESSSNQSQRRQIGNDGGARKKYEDGWKRSSYQSTSQFQPSGELDLYGHESDKTWQRQRHEDGRRLADNYRKSREVHRDNDWVAPRKTSDAGPHREGPYKVMRAHSHHNIHRPRAPRRSNSQHNLENLDYVAEMRFP